jgi:predicted HTH domain antitoxin
MTLTIPDDILEAAKLDERAMLVELACHLFDKERLSLGQSARMAGMTRGDFEDELHDRKIAIYRYGVEEFEQDLRALERWRKERES